MFLMDSIRTMSQLNEAKGLKIVHLNVRSLPKKIDQIRLLMSQSKIDFLTLSETWLKPHLHSDICHLDGYENYRLDRGTNNGRRKRGGGLMTYINNNYSSLSEDLGDLNASNGDIEAQWTLIQRPNCKI